VASKGVFRRGDSSIAAAHTASASSLSWALGAGAGLEEDFQQRLRPAGVGPTRGSLPQLHRVDVHAQAAGNVALGQSCLSAQAESQSGEGLSQGFRRSPGSIAQPMLKSASGWHAPRGIGLLSYDS
jgi:hypothetical protein